MNVVDSCGWLEYIADGPNAGFFAGALEDVSQLIVPSISLYEVYKRVLQQRGEDMARQIAAAMMQARVVDLDADIAVSAARLAVETKLPMADSIMLATARLHKATLWTQDVDLEGCADVTFVSKRMSG